MLLGARQFFERRGAPTPPLPYDAEVQYLETQPKSSPYKQYIDTAIPSQIGLHAIVKFMWLSDSIRYDNYILAQTGDKRTYFGTYQSKWMFGCYQYWQADGIQENVEYVADMVWDIGTPYLDIDGTRTIAGSNSMDITNNGTMLLLSRQMNHTAFAAHARLYMCKLYQGSVLVRDFIPVRVGSGSAAVGYMYDRVSGTLFGNDGTGSFIIGPDKS